MLMDEPFGAIDPIVRARLQDEFLRLQGELRKTVVFVTHDIDEAIKIGDRIAILREGGVLAQYDTPMRSSTHPVDKFVADFVGRDRALKALALRTLGELELAPATTEDGLPRLSGGYDPAGRARAGHRRAEGWNPRRRCDGSSRARQRTICRGEPLSRGGRRPVIPSFGKADKCITPPPLVLHELGAEVLGQHPPAGIHSAHRADDARRRNRLRDRIRHGADRLPLPRPRRAARRRRRLPLRAAEHFALRGPRADHRSRRGRRS